MSQDNHLHETKSSIVGKVESGRWDSETAEKVASRLDDGPLATTPDPTLYDPMQEPHWSVLMTLAWIMWRAPDQVRDFWDKWRTECLVWSPIRKVKTTENQIINSQLLESKKPATLIDLVICESWEKVHGNEPLVPRQEAEEKLFRRLGHGEFEASGVKRGMQDREPLRPDQFHGVKVIEERGQVVLSTEPIGSPQSERWHDVIFPSRKVMEYWPSESDDKLWKRTKPDHVVVVTYKELFPEGPSTGMQKQRRNDFIRSKIKSSGGTPPSDRTIRRHLKEFE